MSQFSVSLFFFLCILDYVYGRGTRIVTANVTQVLDTLLANDRYDKRLRPGFGGPPITISVNLAIKSMGPVSEDDQSFGLDCYFRQQWYDLRLKYQKIPGLEEFSMSWLFLEKVWKPDTYFVNGKKSYLHRITVPNKFLRLRPDGHLTYSMRLTLTANCPMYLRKFPLDAQRCPLVLGSYGYSTKDVLYKWADGDSVGLEPGVELAQFDLVNVTKQGEKLMFRSNDTFSTLQADFWLKRHTGYFMLQVYVPCGLIVLCSWVSFWIDPDDVAARVALGVTTVLSLTTMGFGGRAQLPKVSYWTALDWFVIICFTSVFSVMIEYAIVNFIDKVTKDLKSLIQSRKKDTETEENLKKAKEQEVSAEKTTLELKENKETHLRTRSASFSVTSLVEEQPCRRVSVGYELYKQPDKKFTSGINLLGSKFNIPDIGKRIQAIRKIPRKLSTTIKDFINVSELEESSSRSIQNLSNEEEKEFRVPKVVVSDSENGDLIDLEPEMEPEPVDMVLEVDPDPVEDVWENGQETNVENNKVALFDGCTKMKSPRELWENLKILPQEMDVLKLLEDPNPPDKFSKIDIHSRRSFPIAFIISLTIYSVAFSYYLTDDFPERSTDIIVHKQSA